MEKYCTAGQAIDDNMALAYCMLDNYNHTHTHTHTQLEYVIRIAFPLQQWLHERASMVRLYVSCLSLYFRNSYIRSPHRETNLNKEIICPAVTWLNPFELDEKAALSVGCGGN